MHVYNNNVPFEFYQAFNDLVRNSSLHGKAGNIVLSSDWTTLERCAALRGPDQTAPARHLARARTPNELFMQVLAAIDPSPMPPSLPPTLRHPGPGNWWWLCFCDPARQEGQQFLGVAVVQGTTLRDAIESARALGAHPGGEVASVACTRLVPTPRWRCRLLTREEVIAAGNDMQATD